MKVNPNTFEELNTPYYILEEGRLRANLELISHVAREAGIEVILAFKAYALWRTFPIFREYITATCTRQGLDTRSLVLSLTPLRPP